MQETSMPAASTTQPSPGIALWLWRWFWRVTLVVSLGYAWYCFYVPSNDIAWADEYSAARQKTAESGKPMIIFFTGKWCVPCRIMKRTVWADDEVKTIVNAGFTPVLVDVSASETPSEVLEQYKVHTTPTTIITDANGNVLEQVQGAMGKSEFLKLLENHRVQNLEQ